MMGQLLQQRIIAFCNIQMITLSWLELKATGSFASIGDMDLIGYVTVQVANSYKLEYLLHELAVSCMKGESY